MSFPRCFSLFFLYNLSQLLGALALIVASVDFGTEKPNLSGQEKNQVPQTASVAHWGQ